MKHLLRKYKALASEREAESYGFYEAKHTRVFTCAEGTLHERCSLHFSYTEGVLHCRAPKFSRDKNKNPPRKVGFELCHRHNVFISSRTVRTAAKPQKLSGGEFLVRMTEPGSVNRCSRRDNQKNKNPVCTEFL